MMTSSATAGRTNRLSKAGRFKQPEDAAPIDQMTRDRLGIQKLTLIKRRTLHTPIVPTPRNQRPPRHALFSRVLDGME